MKNFFVNSFSGIIQIILTLILSFIAIPQLIYKFGTEFYGVLSLLLLIGNINIFINFGFNASLIKFLSQQGKTRESDVDIVTAFISLSAIISFLTIFCVLFYKFVIIYLLDIPVMYLNNRLIILFMLLLLSNVLTFLSQIPSAILDSMQKIYVTNSIQTVYNMLNWTFILIAINISDNIAYIGAAYSLSAVILFLLISGAARKYWGGILAKISMQEFRISLQKQFNYGLKIYSSGMLSFFNEPFTKILISHFVTLDAVGFYDIALRIKNQITNIFSKIYYPLYPYLSQLDDKRKLRSLIHDIEQKAYYLTLPFISLIIFAIPPFINIWLGKNVEIISTSIAIITTGYMLFSINVTPIYLYLIVKDQPGKVVLIQGVNVLVNIISFYVFSLLGSIYAGVWSNTLAIMISFIFCIHYQKKYLQSLIFDNFLQFIKAIILCFGTIIIMYYLNSVLSSDIEKLVILSFSLTVISILFYRYLKIFSKNDINKYILNIRINKILTTILVRS